LRAREVTKRTVREPLQAARGTQRTTGHGVAGGCCRIRVLGGDRPPVLRKADPERRGHDPDLPESAGKTVLAGTEMMRKVRFPDDGRSCVEVEAGVLWLELENELRSSHRALTVYPTSAPPATVWE